MTLVPNPTREWFEVGVNWGTADGTETIATAETLEEARNQLSNRYLGWVDRTEIEEKIITNIRQLIEPYIQKLRGTHLDEKQMAFVSIIQSNLADITSPFLSNLAPPYLNLTPTEIQIADLIKQGRDTKEIAALMHLSWRTIKTHRRNIRSKLNLQNRKTNLRSYLMSFQ